MVRPEKKCRQEESSNSSKNSHITDEVTVGSISIRTCQRLEKAAHQLQTRNTAAAVLTIGRDVFTRADLASVSLATDSPR